MRMRSPNGSGYISIRRMLYSVIVETKEMEETV